jgi:uncharacterized protein (DUF1778 family)
LSDSAGRRIPVEGSAADAKSERLNLRLSTEQKRTIERAAALSGLSLTDFILSTVSLQSRRLLREWEVIRLTNRDRDLFLAALDRSAARPLPGLGRAATRHKKALG